MIDGNLIAIRNFQNLSNHFSKNICVPKEQIYHTMLSYLHY